MHAEEGKKRANTSKTSHKDRFCACLFTPTHRPLGGGEAILMHGEESSGCGAGVLYTSLSGAGEIFDGWRGSRRGRDPEHTPPYVRSHAESATAPGAKRSRPA